MSDVTFRVQHRTHSGGVISSHTPANDSLRWSYKATDIGDIGYDLALYDDPFLVSAGENSFAPYKTDYYLQMSIVGGSYQSIQGGMHTNVNLRPRTGVVSVSGKDWLHWLEQPVWFDKYAVQFDPGELQTILDADVAGYEAGMDANGFYQSEYAYVWAGALGAKHRDVISFLVNSPDSYAGSTNNVNLQPVYNGFADAGGTLFTYFIMFQDQTNVLEHIKTIAQMNDPYGYDFYVDWDRKIYFFGPRRKITAAADPTWILSAENIVLDTVPDFDWTNNGPIGTHIVGLGPGNPAIWRMKRDQDSVDKYRQWLRIEQVGESYSRTTLDGIVNSIQRGVEALQYIYPHKDLKLSVYPNKVNPDSIADGFLNHTGDIVRFKWEIWPYHTINAYFWITQQEYHGDAAGNWICDLGLEQIYDVDI